MYVIAEIGINHGGNMSLAQDMIAAAKTAGADVVKFQLYDSEILLKDTEFLDQVRPCDLSREQYNDLAGFARSLDIQCSASTFDLERLEWLKATSPPFYKIGGRAFKDVKLVEATLESGLTYISLGMADEKLVKRYAKHPNARFLSCKSQYPAVYEASDLDRAFQDKKQLKERWSGVSCHEAGIGYALFMAAHGAKVIEKHFTTSRELSGVDMASSIEPTELRQLCSIAPELEKYSTM